LQLALGQAHGRRKGGAGGQGTPLDFEIFSK